MSAAIRFSAIKKRFGELEALKGIDLEVHEGEFFALLGPNGAGKTTLISVLGGLTRPDSGSVTVMGSDVQADYRAARRKVGIVPQELTFDPFFTVRETLQFQSGYFGLRRNDVWIDELLENLGLADKAHANMRALSGGMKRRVMVAQALVHKPPVIVLDEPTAGVDVTLRQTLWAFIQRLNAGGHTIVLTTHYLEEAEMLCNRIAMLKQGELVALDDKAALMQSHTARLLSLRLFPDALPAALHPLLVAERDGAYHLRLDDYNTLEGILALLRESGVGVRDIEIVKPDLESVFLDVMGRKAE
ncbi:ABC transporter ATP-binding protein [Chitinimonas sp. BJB300]|uniref:ABC transporter ATP-binding protein n=1 Tax=Chitinimonas sp. BJB300 TaxID=1559339 RepID=UPI000C0F01A3|nr:ABC transporter ATP-binding protein [Chitinimonas sp. BJB300]PHV10285.1 ABC transporter ATP-binding protein [Chitinimonas sp. BJB300]TSJ91534.1 ABC transporter ATP-binding protein [Chitinimonas sp. BJB300]